MFEFLIGVSLFMSVLYRLFDEYMCLRRTTHKE